MNNEIVKGYYSDGITNIKLDLENIKKNYLSLGYHLKQIKDFGWYRYKYAAECFDKYCKDEFGLSKSTVCRLIQIIDKFCLPDSSDLKDEYKLYSQSQLIEMLPLSDDDIAYVSSHMTIKEIRQLKSYEKVVDTYVIPGQQTIDDYTIEPTDIVATSQQPIPFHKPIETIVNKCTFDSAIPCNIINASEVAINIGVYCTGVCCWYCEEPCGARCNTSVRNKSNEPKLSYIEQRKIDLTVLYHCTRQEFNKYDCLPEPGKKKKFKFGPYEMSIECKGENIDV